MKKYNALLNRTSKRYRIYSHLPRTEDAQYPITLEIFPTNRCNSSCSFCAFSNLRNRDEIPPEAFERLIEDISNSPIKSVSLAGGGEPLIYKNIHASIRKLSECGIDVGLITNGLKMDQDTLDAVKMCSWIRFSLLSPTPEDYHDLTGTSGNNHRVICDNIKKVTANNNDSLYVSASYMANAPGDNLERAKAFIELAASLKLDQIFFKKLVSNFIESNEPLDFYSENSKDIIALAQQKGVITNIQKLISKEKSQFMTKAKNEPCEILRLNLVGLINASGDYFPCFYQYVNAGLKYGNIIEEDLATVLGRRSEIIKQIECNSCEFCRHWSLRAELAKYRQTGEILQCDDPHYNFI